MFKKTIAFLLFTFLVSSSSALACVGRTLYIGAINNSDDLIMAEMLSLLINERTGTTVQTRFFDSRDALYAALKSTKEEERVDILVEDTIDGLAVMHRSSSGNADKDYETIKDLYDQELSVVWLNPLGFSNSKEGAPSVSAPLVRRDVLVNFPLLPRVLNKLGGSIDDTTYARLKKEVADGEKPKNAAKAFLKKKKFI